MVSVPSDKAQIIHVDKDKVSVVDCSTGSRTLKFPGCAEIKADIQLLKELSTNLFASVDFGSRCRFLFLTAFHNQLFL